MPKVPGPDELPSEEDAKGRPSCRCPSPRATIMSASVPLEIRPVEIKRYTSREPGEPRFHVWIKTPAPAGRSGHSSVLAYASDMTLLDTSLFPHGRTVFDPVDPAGELDHAMVPPALPGRREWLLSAGHAKRRRCPRPLARTHFQAGRDPVASVAQEGLIRERRS